MPDFATRPLRLAEEFPPVHTEDWEAAIRGDLAGADYERKLVWQTGEGISVRPYYRAEDAADLRALADISFEAPEPEDLIDAAQFGEAGATTVQELGYGMAAAQDKLAAGIFPGSVGIVFSVGTNFFFEIAKLRAARILWYELTGRALYIEARTSLSDKSIYDPYANLLRATSEAMSALIGGAAAITVQPFGFRERLGENVEHILREESKLDAVTDPAAGAWYVEVLTASIADEARKLMQQISSAGGFRQAKASVDDAIAEARRAREKAIAERRRVLVGVNYYPDVNETRDASSLPNGPAGLWRAAAPFEAIRLRSDEHAKRTGHRPTVLLLMRGDVKMRTARAHFCRNFFGCGGFAIIESHDVEPSADLVVLCSSDAEYPALAADVCRRTDKPVIVAGNPREYMQELNALGVAGSVHVLANALDTLQHWQKQLGIGQEQSS